MTFNRLVLLYKGLKNKAGLQMTFNRLILLYKGLKNKAGLQMTFNRLILLYKGLKNKAGLQMTFNRLILLYKALKGKAGLQSVPICAFVFAYGKSTYRMFMLFCIPVFGPVEIDCEYQLSVQANNLMKLKVIVNRNRNQLLFKVIGSRSDYR